MEISKKLFLKQKLALETGDIGSWEWNISTNIVKWSENLKEIHGMKKGEFDGKFESFIGYVYPKDRKRLQAAIQRSIDEDIPYQIEHRWIRDNGEVIWLKGKGQVFRDKKGRAKSMIGICMDITKRKHAEQELRRSKEKYRTLFNSMEEGFCILEVLFDDDDKPYDYRFIETNTSVGKLLEIEEVEGKKVKDIFPDLEESWVEKLAEVTLTGEAIYFDNYLGAVDRWFALHAFPVGEPDEHKVAVLFNDITNEKQKQHSDALLSAIINNSDDAIISKNLDGIITSWNVGAKHMFGYTNQEAIGQPITIIIPEERLDEENEILDQLRRGERVEHFETVRKSKNGTFLDVSLTISPVKDHSGKVVGASKIARDITEQKRAEEELKTLNETLEERVKERTASLLSYQNQLRSLAMQLSNAEEQERHQLANDLHDNLGQLLAICKMKISLIHREQKSSEMAEVLELVNEAITYTRELMSDLKPPPSLDDKDLKTALKWVARKMKKHDLKVIVEEKDNRTKPLIEEVRFTLLRSTRELLFNVVKHADVSEAKVTLAREGDQIKVTIEDKGPGFDADERMNKSLDEGFGLFSIAERMDFLNGNIEIDSKQGKGTRVTLTAPVLKDVEKVAAKTAASESSPSEPAQKIKILIADDHQLMREGLRKKIEEEKDLTVIAEASNGEEALKLAKETPPDIVVMDITMPKMDGITATKRIKEEFPDIHVIGLSSDENEDFAREMLNVGASAYLTKSEAFEILSATIRSEATAEKGECRL